MLSSSLPSGSAVSLLVPYFLGNCGSQIWSHAHFFMVGPLTLFQSLQWNCARENSTEWQNYKMWDARTIPLLHLLYSLWEFFQIHDLLSIWRMRLGTSDTTIRERQGAHGVLATPQTPSAELVEGSAHALAVMWREGRRWEEASYSPQNVRQFYQQQQQHCFWTLVLLSERRNDQNPQAKQLIKA